MVDDIRAGFVYVARHPVLRSVILLFATTSAVLAPVSAALTFRVVRDLGQSPAAFGLTLTGFGVGTLVGSVFATRLGHATNVARVLVVSVLVMGSTLVAAAIVPSLPAVIALTAISGAGEAALVVVYISVRAANSPDALLGRIASTARVIALALMPIGMLIGGVLIDAIGGSGTLVVLGAGMCVLALAFTQVRGLRNASLAPSSGHRVIITT
jgi:predicted MFS family arabinose efflux permease